MRVSQLKRHEQSFTFKDLGEVARKQVYQRSASLDWGEGNRSSQRN
ncbi:hypothetical protein GX50_07587 [[Emmonsia] crescens]|uniref:Uncharacterized protein n=1 Tax=[Emmonsia] crescens TaxID=73230 RepID=A0A2B7Z6V4_9EURO|nr:hypothetical protein GX50_07587 [Emmonsia crescens]